MGGMKTIIKRAGQGSLVFRTAEWPPDPNPETIVIDERGARAEPQGKDLKKGRR